MTPREENDLVKEFMPIVYSTVKRLNIKGAGFDDAVQEGRIAVLMAIRGFDPTEGTKLSTWVYSKVGWRLKDWMDTETRVRSGRAFKPTHGGEGNEARDWAPNTTDNRGKGPGPAGSGDDYMDIAYPYLADTPAPSNTDWGTTFSRDIMTGEPITGDIMADGDVGCLELRKRVLEALSGLHGDVLLAAESLLRGETIKQTAEALGKCVRTAATRRKQAATALAPLREEIAREALA